MSHFYANIQGSRGEATRQGTKNSGIAGHIRGWDIGARVYICHNKDLDRDEVTVSISRGSNDAGIGEECGTFYLESGQIIKAS